MPRANRIHGVVTFQKEPSARSKVQWFNVQRRTVMGDGDDEFQSFQPFKRSAPFQ
jgi:hypothetical protein